jgi:diadenosine tetraphosphatase ApaH/serine/threonine PP2A family protein phosphatase
MDVYSATTNFDYFNTAFCFVGHSHLPVMYYLKNGKELATVSFVYPGEEVRLPEESIVNPGSVGQPRDHDPRAAYTIFDTKKKIWAQHRVAYNVADVQERMSQAGLPSEYIQRLDSGW